MNDTTTTQNDEVIALRPDVDTKIDIDQTQIINLGISRKENALEAALHDMEQKLRPLIVRHQEINQEIAAALPKAADKASESFRAPIAQAFKLMGDKVKFEVTGSSIDSMNKNRGFASLKVSPERENYTSEQISSKFAFDLPEDVQANQAALKALDLQLAAGRSYQVELKKALQNLPREERNLKGQLAEHVLSQSDTGRKLLEVIEGGMLPIPQAPDLLLLGNGGNAKPAAAKKSRATRK